MRNTRSIVTCSKNKEIIALCTAILCSFGGMAWAADNATGAGNGVAVGTSSNAPKAENVAIGKGASIAYSNGASNATGDIVVGNGANINNYASQGGSVAIGKNAKVENMAGGGEASFAFGQTTFSGSWFSLARIPTDPTKVVGSVAIGDNTFARTGSTMIGSHNYKGALGDTTVDSASTRTSALNVYATTIGANSFSNGAFTTSTGVYNIISSDYNGGRLANPVKNLGATINGSLNSIEGMSGNYYSGIANTVSGVANRTFNSNGSLIYGAGNEITNSVVSLYDAPTDSGNSAKAFAETLRGVIRNNNGGGSTMAIGGGNKADYTQKTSIIGVNNTITGTSAKVANLNSVSGFKNTVTNASNNIIMGNDHTVTADNTVAIGGLSSADTRSVANTTSVGYDSKVSVEDGVALGYKSNSTVDKGLVGYDITGADHSGDTTGTWKSTAAAVSVGDASTGLTRQITNVAAGTKDTDAVNVAQLKALDTKVANGTVHYYSAKSSKHGAGSNYDNDGATADDSMVIGVSSSSDGVNSTVLGNNNTLTGEKNGKNNSIVVGQGLTVAGTHNAVFGTDYENYDHKATMVYGEANTVLGVGNLVGYTAKKDPSDPTKWIYTKNSSGSDQNVVVGLTNTANGGSVVVGTSSVSDSLGTSIGHGNTIIGMDDQGGQRGVAVGNDLTVKGEEAVAIGTKAEANADWTIAMGSKAQTEKDMDMAIGYGAKASGGWSMAMGVASIAEGSTSTALGYMAKATVDEGVALGSYSVANTEAEKAGYDPSTKSGSTNTTSTWKSTAAAVSVGNTASGITRQITGVAAGTSDTDAVNVAQLKKAVAGAADGNDTLVSGTDGLSLSGNTLSMTVKDTAGNEVKGSVDLSSIAGSADTRNTVTAGENVKIDETPNADGSSTYKINVKADGKVESGNTSIVTGGTVYNETHPTTNGTYISKDKSAGENLTALDNQVKTNADSISRMGNSIDKLGNRINRVGAGAAALAALHPQDFDPDDKWDFAAGYGNYKSAHAVAVGAFYRPTEDTMLSVGGSFGGGENMINAGVTFKLGQHNHVSRSRVAIAKEVLALRQDNQELRNEVNELKTMLKQGRTSDIKNVSFPDVPKDHWAYDYVKTLADRGYVTGYPDGEFKGDRSLTRYEYAAIIYRALQNGAPSDADMAKAVNEFGPELEQVQNIERFRVDRISGKDNDRHKVERVRINDKDNKAKNDYRDVYGTSIQK